VYLPCDYALLTIVSKVEAEMKEAEAKRAALIGALDLRVVGGGRPN
jgi:hypothetical protein